MRNAVSRSFLTSERILNFLTVVHNPNTRRVVGNDPHAVLENRVLTFVESCTVFMPFRCFAAARTSEIYSCGFAEFTSISTLFHAVSHSSYVHFSLRICPLQFQNFIHQRPTFRQRDNTFDQSKVTKLFFLML